MIIQLEDQDENEIISFDLPCNPFKVGEVISVNQIVRPTFESKWEVERIDKKFKVLKIEHYFRRAFTSSPNESFATVLTVKEHETN